MKQQNEKQQFDFGKMEVFPINTLPEELCSNYSLEQGICHDCDSSDCDGGPCNCDGGGSDE